MATYTRLTERTQGLLRKHRRELIKIAKNPRWTDAKKDEERQALAEAIGREVEKLQADIAAAQAQQRDKAKPTALPATEDTDVLDRAWDRIEPDLKTGRAELGATITEVVAEAGKRGDVTTIAALKRRLPAFISTMYRGEAPHNRDTVLAGLQAQVDQAARAHLPEQEQTTVPDRARKDDARLTLLVNGLNQGVKDPDRYIVLPDFKDNTVTVPGLSATSDEDEDD